MVRKVGKYVRLRHIECKCCHSYLEYEKEDTEMYRTKTYTEGYIRCPVCVNRVVVSEWVFGNSEQRFYTVEEKLVLDKE